MIEEKIGKNQHYENGYRNGAVAGVWKGRTKERKDLIKMIDVALSSPSISQVTGSTVLTLLKKKLVGIERQIVIEKRQERKAYRKQIKEHRRKRANVLTNSDE